MLKDIYMKLYMMRMFHDSLPYDLTFQWRLDYICLVDLVVTKSHTYYLLEGAGYVWVWIKFGWIPVAVPVSYLAMQPLSDLLGD